MSNSGNDETKYSIDMTARNLPNVSAVAVSGVLVPPDSTIAKVINESGKQTSQPHPTDSPDLAFETRRDVKTSTGPRTPEGKQRAKHNAIRHGIFADIVLTGGQFRESREDYSTLLEKLREDIRPVGALQEVQVEQLAFEFLRLGRVYKADLQVTPLVFEQLHKDIKKNSSSVFGLVDQKDEYLVIRRELASELLLRYGNSVSKQIHRILDSIERLQRMQKDQ